MKKTIPKTQDARPRLEPFFLADSHCWVLLWQWMLYAIAVCLIKHSKKKNAYKDDVVEG